MEARSRSAAFPGLIVALLILFVVSFPGFGIESRPYSSYAPWAGPIFLVLVLLLFAGGVVGLILWWRGSGSAPYGGFMMGIAAIATILFDLSRVGGPAPPTGPLVLSGIGLVIAVPLLYVSYCGLVCPPGSCEPEPPSTDLAAGARKDR